MMQYTGMPGRSTIIGKRYTETCTGHRNSSLLSSLFLFFEKGDRIWVKILLSPRGEDQPGVGCQTPLTNQFCQSIGTLWRQVCQ